MSNFVIIAASFRWLGASASSMLIIGNVLLVASGFMSSNNRHSTDGMPQILFWSGLVFFAVRFFVWLSTATNQSKFMFTTHQDTFFERVSEYQHSWPFILPIAVILALSFLVFYLLVPRILELF